METLKLIAFHWKADKSSIRVAVYVQKRDAKEFIEHLRKDLHPATIEEITQRATLGLCDIDHDPAQFANHDGNFTPVMPKVESGAAFTRIVYRVNDTDPNAAMAFAQRARVMVHLGG